MDLSIIKWETTLLNASVSLQHIFLINNFFSSFFTSSLLCRIPSESTISSSGKIGLCFGADSENSSAKRTWSLREESERRSPRRLLLALLLLARLRDEGGPGEKYKYFRFKLHKYQLIIPSQLSFYASNILDKN